MSVDVPIMPGEFLETCAPIGLYRVKEYPWILARVREGGQPHPIGVDHVIDRDDGKQVIFQKIA